MKSFGQATLRRMVSLARRMRAWFQRDRRKDIAATYLKGDGIEIGALHNPLRIPRGARVRYVDRMSVEDLRRQYPELAFEPLTPIDIIDDGEKLSSLGESTQHFVIANHFLEHCENPLGAIQQMVRVLRPGGVLYVAVPDKRFTFDAERPVTKYEHIAKDYAEGPEISRRQHYEEWVKAVEKKAEPGEIEKRVATLMGRGYSIHFHVWTSAEILEIFSRIDTLLDVKTDLEVIVKNGEEVIAVIRKQSQREISRSLGRMGAGSNHC